MHIAKSYEAGSRQIACLALECVGFNKVLYELLVDQHKARFSQKSVKRGFVGTAGRLKRQKLDL